VFVTPIDREDIQLLCAGAGRHRRPDINLTARTFVLFGVARSRRRRWSALMEVLAMMAGVLQAARCRTLRAARVLGG
jgi:hypothetical protein